MKRKWWLILSSALMIIAAGLGTSFALYTSQSAAQANQFTSGEVCINAYRKSDMTTGPMFYINGSGRTGLWVPGDVHKRSLRLSKCPGGEPAYVESISASAAGDLALAEKLRVKITTRLLLWDLTVAQGRLDEFLDGEVELRFPAVFGLAGRVPLYLLGQGHNRDLHVEVRLPKGVNDNYEDMNLVVTFTANAIQMEHVDAIVPAGASIMASEDSEEGEEEVDEVQIWIDNNLSEELEATVQEALSE